MFTDIPLSSYENKDKVIFNVKFKYSRYLKYLFLFFLSAFIGTLSCYLFLKSNILLLYFNFLTFIILLINVIPCIFHIYVTFFEQKQVSDRIESDIEF
jgi:magnesium-transporting ATPase (P-type)